VIPFYGSRRQGAICACRLRRFGALALVNLYRYTLVLALLMGAANHPLRSKWEQGDQTGFFVALAAILFSAIC